MKISYNVNVNPTAAESFLASSVVEDSQLFIHKGEGFVTLNVEFNSLIDFTGEIFTVKETKTKTKIFSNTENVLVTNIVVDDIPYFYKLQTLGSSTNYQKVILDSSIDCIEYKGNIYTNDIIINEEISDGFFIHSTPVITKKQSSIVYRANDIEITYPSTLGKLFYKIPETVVQPTLINSSKVHIPSFYCKDGYKTLKCIEGDIKFVNKNELTYFVGNKIQCKDYISEYHTHFYNPLTNSIYLQNFNFKTTPALVKYTAKLSSHIFRMENSKMYFKVTSQGLVESTVDDYHFLIEKKIDVTKLKVIVSSYLNSYNNTLNPSDFVLTKTVSTNESENVGLKNQVVIDMTRFPSERVYIEYKNRYIFQNENSLLQTSALQDLVVPDTYSQEDYTFQTTDIYDEYKFVTIDGINYYKNGESYYSVFIQEDDNTLLYEDLLKLLLEF